MYIRARLVVSMVRPILLPKPQINTALGLDGWGCPCSNQSFTYGIELISGIDRAVARK
jgi:hypothetical protein